MPSSDINPEWKLLAIGRGSFAFVSVLSGRPVAFKQVISSTRTPELKTEFEALCSIYDFCNTDSFFAITRPLAYYNPHVSTSFFSPDSSPINVGRTRVRRRPRVVESDFKVLGLDSAAYAMDQVLPLPLSTASVIRQLFYPPGQETATLPSLCRLYFGKVIETAAGRPRLFFFNSANFPLDVSRYRRMAEALDVLDYPTVDDIVYGMGEMLARLHWYGGYDGRDIEFIMGGASFSGVAMHVIDFNQVSRHSTPIHAQSSPFSQDAPLVEEKGTS